MTKRLSVGFDSAAGAPVGPSGIRAAQEADHRIANSIQLTAIMLKRESRGIVDADSARAALERASVRLMATARLHRHLSQDVDGTSVDLARFLAPVCAEIEDSTDAILRVRADDVLVSADIAAQLCLVITELALNAVKHGSRDGAPVTLSLEAAIAGRNNLRLLASDDGPGGSAGPTAQGGFGMRMITSTVARLGGRVDITYATGTGITCEIEVPAYH